MRPPIPKSTFKRLLSDVASASPPDPRTPPLPRVTDLLRLYSVPALTHLSQNFLLDQNITDKIVRLVPSPSPGSSAVVEVGPGPGMLTRSLVNGGFGQVVGLEKDKRFAPLLDSVIDAHPETVKIKYDDAMNYSLSGLSGLCDPGKDQWHLVANLPFGVATHLLVTWMQGLVEEPHTRPASMTLMFQEEVAQRIIAPAHNTHRSRLSVLVQLLCDATLAYTLPSEVFTPKPSVNAGLTNIIPRSSPLLPPHIPFPFIQSVLRRCFSSRRKMLRRTWRKMFPLKTKEVLEEKWECARPQELETEVYALIIQRLFERGQQGLESGTGLETGNPDAGDSDPSRG